MELKVYYWSNFYPKPSSVVVLRNYNQNRNPLGSDLSDDRCSFFNKSARQINRKQFFPTKPKNPRPIQPWNRKRLILTEHGQTFINPFNRKTTETKCSIRSLQPINSNPVSVKTGTHLLQIEESELVCHVHRTELMNVNRSGRVSRTRTQHETLLYAKEISLPSITLRCVCRNYWMLSEIYFLIEMSTPLWGLFV